MKTLSDSRNRRRRSVTYILLSCIRKHGAERERVKFAVYEMLQLNFELEGIATPYSACSTRWIETMKSNYS